MSLEEKDGCEHSEVSLPCSKTQPAVPRDGKAAGKSVWVTNEDLKAGSTKILFWTIPKLTFIYTKHIIEMSEENN